MRLRQLPALLLGLATGSAALAQPTPPSTEEEIVVTGRRDGGGLLSVDSLRVARQCAECRRILGQIDRLAKIHQARKRQIARDRDTMVESIGTHAAANPASAARFMERVPEHFRKDEMELLVMRRDVSGLVASFLAQLEPHVVAVTEEERRERGASAVVRMLRRASAKRPQEVTDAIIRRLNARDFTIVLPGI